MSAGEVLQRLASRANEADVLVKVLKDKIASIRATILADFCKSEEKRLTDENTKLLKQVDVLKSRLSDLQSQNGAVHVKCTPASSAPQEPIKTAVPEAVEKSNTELSEKQKKPKANKEKKPQPKKAAAAEPDVPIDIRRIDLRVGRIISAEKHPDADTLYVEKVDVGEAEPRTVVSGLVNFVPIEKMSNRLAILMCNLKPVKMRGVVSQAMVMCASSPDKVEILDPPSDAVPGELVEFEGYPSGVADAQLNPKKKIWEQVAPDLKTNNECVATYKGVPFTIANKGIVKAATLTGVQVK